MVNALYVRGGELTKPFTFYYIPRVACTGWKLYIAEMEGLTLPINPFDIHRIADDCLRQCSNPQSSLTPVAMVRDPRTRILSAYLEKVTRYSADNHPWWDVVRKDIADFAGAEPAGVSFADFLRWLKESGSPYVTDAHWLSYSRLLPEPPSALFLLSFERFQASIALLRRELAIRCEFPGAERTARHSTTAAAIVDSVFAQPGVASLFAGLYEFDLCFYAAFEATCADTRQSMLRPGCLSF